MPLASIPSPSQGVWYLFGVVPLRAYALCIVLGVIAAVVLGERRWRARGGEPGTIVDLAVWAVPFGLVGGRLYHVITDWQLYFGPDAPKEPIEALFIWQGGLGIWGAIALGALGVWFGCRGRGISLSAVADTVAPGVALAQAIGRWGNYFNQELFGSPTDLPWGLEIDPDRPGTVPGEDTYHPTFLYESIWDLGLALVLIWAGRRFALRHGRVFALYVAGYTVGRFWIEGLRVDPAHHILGLRLNQWTSIIVFLGAVAYFWYARNKSNEEKVRATPDPTADPAADLGDPADPAHPSDQADEADEAGESDGAEPAGDAGDHGSGKAGAETPAGASPAPVSAAPAEGDRSDGDAEGTAREEAPRAALGTLAAEGTVDPAHPAGEAEPAENDDQPGKAPGASAGAARDDDLHEEVTGTTASEGGKERR
ncbi:prolipoprotein diacylglyceryl transferase [Streptosporangium becharense]|uniref:Phosphatidylglycerol--prolipoprotein diacylglyceryl transferase n=1 Tax=Streptosporangium becharense TaxID=1816182 RepID=A0A7W9ICN6_9ACTN|nr:prolipoprotein diacylglyceryl transferase [Streptosporangium becharense]MBB2912918.1 prolipoprotein diacylglyceryl transferase [Streptosporangium becharense]MBB5818257.1 prolipoprotein diacylglyceryl transferase [Streptosporangium becharense]